MFKYMKFMYLNTEALECEVQIHEYEYTYIYTLHPRAYYCLT